MFSGIVQEIGQVESVSREPTLLTYAIAASATFLEGIKVGASVSVDGVCQTVVSIQNQTIWFEAIEETLTRTTLNFLENGQKVDLERSLRLGDEIGGHLISGHVYGIGVIEEFRKKEHNCFLRIKCPSEWMKYFFVKGYVAIDGASLTVVDVDQNGYFSVHLIPETLQKTVLGWKRERSLVNIEIDSHTQAIVETIERLKL